MLRFPKWLYLEEEKLAKLMAWGALWQMLTCTKGLSARVKSMCGTRGSFHCIFLKLHPHHLFLLTIAGLSFILPSLGSTPTLHPSLIPDERYNLPNRANRCEFCFENWWHPSTELEMSKIWFDKLSDLGWITIPFCAGLSLFVRRILKYPSLVSAMGYCGDISPPRFNPKWACSALVMLKAPLKTFQKCRGVKTSQKCRGTPPSLHPHSRTTAVRRSREGGCVSLVPLGDHLIPPILLSVLLTLYLFPSPLSFCCKHQSGGRIQLLIGSDRKLETHSHFFLLSPQTRKAKSPQSSLALAP